MIFGQGRFFSTLFLLAAAHALLSGDACASLFLESPDRDLAVLFVKPNQQSPRLSPDQIESLGKISGKVDQVMQQVRNSSLRDFSKSFIDALKSGDRNQVLGNSIDQLKAASASALSSIDRDLPSTNELIYSFYLLPVLRAESFQPPASSSVFEPPRLSIQENPMTYEGQTIRSLVIEPQNEIGDAFLSRKIADSYKSLLPLIGSDQKVALAGIAVHVKLLRGKSEVKVQILSSLRPAEMPFAKDNDQVSIERITVPTPEHPEDQLVALMTIRAVVQGEAMSSAPVALMQFGSLAGLDGGSYGNWAGSLKVERNFNWASGSGDDLCGDGFLHRGRNIPALEGRLKAGAIGNRFIRDHFGSLFQNLNPYVKFRIFDFYFDLQGLKVRNLNVRLDVSTSVSFLSFRCLNQRSVQEQLEGEFNSSIGELLGVQDTRGEQLASDMFNAIYAET